MSFDDMNPNPYRMENPGYYFWRSVKIVGAWIAVYLLLSLSAIYFYPVFKFELAPENLTPEYCEKRLGSDLDGFTTKKCIAINLDTYGVVAVGTISPDLMRRFEAAHKSANDVEGRENFFPWHGNLIRVTNAGSGLYVLSSGTERSIGYLNSKHDLALSSARELSAQERTKTTH